MANDIRVRRRFDGQSITGKAAFTAPQGLFVNYDPADMATPSLKKATGVKGFMLGRKIVTQDELQTQLIGESAFPNSRPILNPDVRDGFVSASKVLEIEAEGPDLLLLSGTGALSSSTAVGTELSTNLGRHSVKQSGEEVNGIVRAQLTPLQGNAVRLLIELIP